MSDERTKADPTNAVLSDSYDDMPDLVDGSDSDDAKRDVEISVNMEGKTVKALNARGGRRRKKKRKPNIDMPPKDEKGLSEKVQNRNLIEGGNSSSSAHPLPFLGQTEENQKSEKMFFEKDLMFPKDLMIIYTCSHLDWTPVDQGWTRQEKHVTPIRPDIIPYGLYGDGVPYGSDEKLSRFYGETCLHEYCAKLDGTQCVLKAAPQDVQVCDSSISMSTRKKYREVDGYGPITSIILAHKDEHLFITCRRLENRAEPAHKHGVRQCPWDEEFSLIPILDWETGRIAGYGKKDSIFGCCKNDSYSKEGEKEWITSDDLGDIIGEKKVSRLIAKKHFETREVTSYNKTRVECEITECMLALFLFPRPPQPPMGYRYRFRAADLSNKVCAHALREYLERIGCHDKIDVYRNRT